DSRDWPAAAPPSRHRAAPSENTNRQKTDTPPHCLAKPQSAPCRLRSPHRFVPVAFPIPPHAPNTPNALADRQLPACDSSQPTFGGRLPAPRSAQPPPTTEYGSAPALEHH